MEQNSSSECPFVLSHLGLRKAIGFIGLSLPFVLAFGKLLSDGPGIESSISSYYHTGMRDIFVGAMCAIGIFLFSYKGYDNRDDVAGKLGSLFAIGLALVPTAPDLSQIPDEIFIGNIHLSFASGFFLTLAYFSLYLFTKTHPGKMPTRQKLQRNMIYRICGTLIAAALILIVIVKQIADEGWVLDLDLVFWLESLAVVAFGVSWLTKGEILLKDEAGQVNNTLLSGHR